MMRIGVLIPHRSNSSGLIKAIQSVGKYPVFVVLDGVKRPSFLDPEIVSIESPGLGFAGAVNIGLASMQIREFTHILVMNDDAILAPGSIRVLMKAFGEGVGAVGPKIVEGEQINFGYFVSKWGRIRPLIRPGVAHALSGACMLIPSWVRFDPYYSHGIEDLDLCLRLSAMNLEIVCAPDAVCHHEGGGTLFMNDPMRQRASVFGQLHLFRGKWPAIILLNCLQILREKGSTRRYKAVFAALSDYREGRRPPVGKSRI